ncbi:MAG TPA: hypothetical protein VGT04_05355 [Acidobacteriaceae bacterium]|nr:hypothetical protein [Acidobacteriaceae bacterium]
MAKTTIWLGVALILLGLLGWVSSGYSQVSLIPTYIGIALAIFGGLATTDNAKKRMLFMHIVVTIELIGFLVTVKSIANYVEMMRGRQFASLYAIEDNAATAVVLLFFVLLSVRSFVMARRARTQEK